MAKRELSSTLKNLKFMQRAAQKEVIGTKEEVKEETVVLAGDFPSSTAIKRCVVIVEGDPHPGATRGRMSFMSFNPSIDKLNGEESDVRENESCAMISTRQNGTFARENGSTHHSSDSLDIDALNGDGNSELKRKQPEDSTPETPHRNKSLENSQLSSFPSTSNKSLKKPNKREKLDWNVLRPPKYPRKKH